MKAVILAAGRGTRMRPLTYHMPKPMIPILNQPVMELLVRLLARHGVDQIMVNTSYMAPAIESYFRDGARFGVEMAYSFEGCLVDGELRDEPLGSAGALRKIQDHSGFFDDTFVVLCGDAILDVDLSALLQIHHARGASATIALGDVPRDLVSSYGVAAQDPDGRIRQFQEKPAPAKALSTLVNTGIYIFEPHVLDLIPREGTYDIGGQLLQALIDGGMLLHGARVSLRWHDVGNVADYSHVTRMALNGEVPGLAMPGRQIRPGIWCGLNAKVDPESCLLDPPIFIGGSSTVEAGATVIGPAVIGPGCIVESGAHVDRSIVFDYTRIGPAAHLVDMVVCGRHCVDRNGTSVDLLPCDVDYVISVARTPKTRPSREQQALLELLAGDTPCLDPVTMRV